MNIEIVSTPQYELINLEGEVDLSNSRQIKQAMLDAIAKQRDLVVDLGQLSYIDSSGLASMVEALNESKQSGTKLFIVNAQGAPKQVLKLTRLDTVFQMYASVQEIPDYA